MKSYLPLYLKHRPQALGELVGQQSVVKTLTNAIDNDRIAHAYLFTGPRGCGKTSSARILAKSLNCEKGPTAEPCMTCTMCLEITKGNSPAVLEIDAASNNSVDDARVLIERAPLVAQGGRFKLYIIDECHMLTKEAFNALLKTIEEPPPNVIFILATTEEHKVPPTIISRCQRLMFRLANHKELSQHLRKIAEIENISILDEAIDLIARRSGGGLRDALGLLDQASLLSSPDKPVSIADLLTLLGAIDEDVLIKISEGIRDRDGSSVLSALHSLLSQGREPSLVALELSKHFLNMAKALHLGGKKSAPDGQINSETNGIPLINQLITGTQNYIDEVIKLAPAFEGAELTQMVEQLDRLEQNLRRSTQPALTLEVGLLALCHRHDILMVRELSARVQQLEIALAGGSYTPTGHNTATTNSAAPRPISAAIPAQAPAAAQTYQPVAPPAQPAKSAEAHRVEQILASSQTDQFAHAAKTEAPPTASASNLSDDDNSIESQAIDKQHIESQGRPQSPFPVFETAVPASAPESLPVAAPAIVRSEAIDEFWSNLMDYLQQKSIPTFSIFNQHGFALSLKEDEFVIGVRKEHFVSMLERKLDQIKIAIKTLTGKEMFVKIKVMGEEVGARAPQPAGAASGRESETAGRSAGSPRAADEPSDPAPFRSYTPEATPRASDQISHPREEPVLPKSSPDLAPEPKPDSRPEAKPESKSEPKSSTRSSSKPEAKGEKKPWVPRDKGKEGAWQSGGPAKPTPDFAGSGATARGSDEVLMVKEAYKLFEGPGSRFIG
ncbi:DNA polymerase III subunit gamma/tau [bacterium]|nr:DNA polymerase III subunit gamma/tau [bacterium]MBP9808483.1 DNA polymerase III subunit gamma/tau [bacterium]